MRNEVKIAMVVVLIGVVVSAIYFFSKSDETIEVKTTKPLTPSITSPSVDKGPVDITPKVVEEDETIDLFSSGTDAEEEPATGDAEPTAEEKPVLTINLEPLSETPTTKPAKSLAEQRSEKIASIESVANKVIPNQPISLDDSLTELDSSKSGVIILKEAPEPVVEKFGTTTHVVKEGENLFRISKIYYGRGDRWQDIARANPRINPDRIHIGDKLLIPDISAKAAPSKAVRVKPTGKQRTYKVRYGDSLELIAQEQLGDSTRWPEILELNKKSLRNDPRRLRAESTILLPGR